MIFILQSQNVDLSHYQSNGEWHLDSATMKMNDYVSGTLSWDSVIITLKISRLSLYHAMYYIIPCAMIGLMTIIVFVLPVNINERMTVGMYSLGSRPGLIYLQDRGTRVTFGSSSSKIAVNVIFWGQSIPKLFF